MKKIIVAALFGTMALQVNAFDLDLKDLGEVVKQAGSKNDGGASGAGVSALTDQEANDGLKAALNQE